MWERYILIRKRCHFLILGHHSCWFSTTKKYHGYELRKRSNFGHFMLRTVICNRLVFNEYFCNILEMLYRLCHRYIIVVDFFFKVQAISRFNATSTKKFLEILIEYQSDMKYHPEFQNVDSGYGAITADASLVRLYNAKVRHSQT